MSRVLPRLIAAAAVAACAAIATVLVASPAHAADAVEVDISSLSSSVTAGARGDNFRASMENATNAEINAIRKVFVIRLPGLVASSVRVTTTRGQQLQMQDVADGEVRAVDTLLVRLNAEGRSDDDLRADYTIQFANTAPSGRAELIFQAFRGETLLGSASEAFTIRGGASASATKTTTPAPTESPGNPSFQPAPGNSFAPLDEEPASASANDGSGPPVLLYVMGAGLLGVGGAILWFLFRRRPELATVADDYPTGAYEPVRAPTLGYPAQQAPVNPYPTKVMPTIRDVTLLRPPTDPLLPPSDPWSGKHAAD